MTRKFLPLFTGYLFAFGKLLALFPTIEFIANILSGDIADTIFLTENFEEDLS